MARLTLQFVNRFRDRHGKLRHYFRKPGFKSIALPGLPGSDDFIAAYPPALPGVALPRIAIGEARTQAGTINAAVVAYYGSGVFRQELAKSTQQMRRAILENWRAADGEKRIALLRGHHVVKMLEGRKPNAQKNWMKALRGFMAFAVSQRLIDEDPTLGVRVTKPGKTRGHMTWGDPQIAQYRERHALGTSARLAIDLLLNIAARREDGQAMGRQHMSAGRFTWRPHKTLRTTGKALTIPVMPELQTALDAMPASDALAFIVNDYGKSFASAAAFGNKFADWCDDAGLPEVQCDDGRVRNYRAHGLRKAALRRLAHAGCTGPEIMAISGHSTLAQVQVYLDEVEQARMAKAAMTKAGAETKKATRLTNLPTET